MKRAGFCTLPSRVDADVLFIGQAGARADGEMPVVVRWVGVSRYVGWDEKAGWVALAA